MGVEAARALERDVLSVATRCAKGAFVYGTPAFWGDLALRYEGFGSSLVARIVGVAVGGLVLASAFAVVLGLGVALLGFVSRSDSAGEPDSAASDGRHARAEEEPRQG